jgi:uncharacterized protein
MLAMIGFKSHERGCACKDLLTRRKMEQFRKLIYLAVGWISVGLAIIGVILPILPTTPFLLVAVWAFSKSSPELAEKIRNHKTFGPLVRGWQDHGVVPLKAKAAAFTMMAAMAGYLWVYSSFPIWVLTLTTAILMAAAVYVGSRPSKPD